MTDIKDIKFYTDGHYDFFVLPHESITIEPGNQQISPEEAKPETLAELIDLSLSAMAQTEFENLGITFLDYLPEPENLHYSELLICLYRALTDSRIDRINNMEVLCQNQE